MNRYTEIGPHSRALFSRLKYFVVEALFSIPNSCLHNNILIQSIKFSPYSNFFKTGIEKLWSSELRAFTISIATR